MFPLAAIAAPLIGGALGFAGQESTNTANAQEAQRNREFNAAEAEKNRQFQAGQSATEVQRRVKDLEAAGLNPSLAYNQSASSGSGSSASGSPARFDSSVGAGISSVSAASNIVQDAATKSAERQQILASAEKTAQESQTVKAMRDMQLLEMENRARLHWSASSLNDLRRTVESNLYEPRNILMQAQARQAEAGAGSAIQARRESEERTKLFDPQRKLLEAQIPMAQNMAGMADTWFGKYIAPFLNSAGQIKRLIPGLP